LSSILPIDKSFNKNYRGKDNLLSASKKFQLIIVIFNLSSANISKTVMGLKKNCAQLIIKILSRNNKYI